MRDRLRRSWPRIRRAAAGAATSAATRRRLTSRVRRRVREATRRERGVRPGLQLPQAHLPDGPVTRPGLRVAVILDPFSELALRYEWDQVQPTPDGWRAELTARPPDLLFVESAWRGNDGAWRLAMTGQDGPSTALRELVAWCTEHGVPTVFWNKEDPPNYERFLATAALFDQVFTVDATRLPDYRRDLGHDRVALLPFAAQPRVHTPVRRGRAHHLPIAFAGTYFRDKHPERRAQLDALLPAAQEHGLHIYSRMQAEDARYRFPARFRGDIVGTLPYPQMLAAATAYRLFLNVNSVTTSPTMCARRLFELSAAQTAVLSGPAASIEPFFGDTVAVATTREEAQQQLRVLMQHPELRDRQALLAHRRVFDEHLYTHRVDTVLAEVGLALTPRRRAVSAVVPTMRPGQLEHVLTQLGQQVHDDLEVVLVTHGFEPDRAELHAMAAAHGIAHLQLLPAGADLTLGACLNLGLEAASGDYVAKIDDDNLYLPHYLSDLVRAFDYTQAQVVGKWAHLVHLSASGTTVLRFPEAEHRYVEQVQGGTLLMATDLARELRFRDLPRQVDSTFLDAVRRGGGQVYSADRFNFVSVREATPDGHTWSIRDADILARPSQVVSFGDPVPQAQV